jgi:(2Fe-2S) ferredoxin
VSRRHLFVCTNARASGKPACGPRGGAALVTAVQRELLARGQAHAALITPCDCLGPCFDGPNAVIYPDATWYHQLDERDAAALVDHLVDGTPLTAKRGEPPGEAD